MTRISMLLKGTGDQAPSETKDREPSAGATLSMDFESSPSRAATVGKVMLILLPGTCEQSSSTD